MGKKGIHAGKRRKNHTDEDFMNIMFTSDLRGYPPWYDWLLGIAQKFHAICVAGDLVDPLRPNLAEQRDMVERVAWELGARSICFFACPGDRDMWGGPWPWLEAQTGVWRHASLIVNSLPWKFQKPFLAEKTRQWRAHEEDGVWIVLEHEPPQGSKTSAGPGSGLLYPSVSLKYRPDYLVCGHVVNAPWEVNGCWWDVSGKTMIFNAGQRWDGHFPAHITLDTCTKTAVWNHPDGQETLDFSALISRSEETEMNMTHH